MDNIFGIGLPELVLILLIAGMVMGPERIAKSARSMGELAARMRDVSNSFFRQLSAELDNTDGQVEFKETIEELNQLRHDVTGLRDEMRSIIAGVAAHETSLATSNRTEERRSIMPPDPTTAKDDGSLSKGHRPPSWSSSDPEEQTSITGGAVDQGATPPPPARRPKRVEIADDPD